MRINRRVVGWPGTSSTGRKKAYVGIICSSGSKAWKKTLTHMDGACSYSMKSKHSCWGTAQKMMSVQGRCCAIKSTSYRPPLTLVVQRILLIYVVKALQQSVPQKHYINLNKSGLNNAQSPNIKTHGSAVCDDDDTTPSSSSAIQWPQ